MTRRAPVIASLLLLVGLQPSLAHDAPATTGQPAEVTAGEVYRLTVEIDPTAAEPPTIQVLLGAQVEITLLGAGDGDLHLHGYDIEFAAVGGQQALVVFHASSTGRFPLVQHVETALLGTRERAVLYIEVRAP